jgi:hypothetical protein
LSESYGVGIFKQAIGIHRNASGIEYKTADFFYRSAGNQQFGNMAGGLLIHEIGDVHHRDYSSSL